jgi:hypothetical protein
VSIVKFRDVAPTSLILRQLRSRPRLTAVIEAVEQAKGEQWAEFRDRHGDWGRDLVLYLGRKQCGLKWKELSAVAGGIDYVSASTAVRRLEHFK